MPVITQARDSVWAAVLNHDPLRDDAGKSIFAQLIKLNDDGATRSQIEPSIRQLPALAIFTKVIDMKWRTYKMQEWLLHFDVLMWTRHWNQETAERHAEELIRAYWKSAPTEGGVTYIKNPTTGTGFDPVGVARIEFEPAKVGPDAIKAMFIKMDLVLRVQVDPTV